MTTDNSNSIELVAENHRAFGVPINHVPTLDNEKVNKLRVDPLEEELSELWSALRTKDPASVLDALADLQYVLDGAFLSLGFGPWKDAAVNEVHRANMSKLGVDGKPIFRHDGKYLKGPNYTPPDIAAVLALPLSEDPKQGKLDLSPSGEK